MKPWLFYFAWVVCFLASSQLSAQNTQNEIHPDRTYIEALELFNMNKYGAAQRMFKRYLQAVPHSDKRIQAEYYAGVCAYYLGNNDFEKTLIQFTEKYPTHAKAKSANFFLGSYYFDQAEYAYALQYLIGSVPAFIRTEEDIAANYKLAYCYLVADQHDDAKKLFDKTKRGSHPYAIPSSYYAGYLAYEAQDFQNALPDLVKAASSEKYGDEALVMAAAIYYKLGHCDSVEQLAQRSDTSQLSEAFHEVLGECAFIQKKYVEAEKHFDLLYKEDLSLLSRDLNYRIGYTKIKVGKPTAAIIFLNKAAEGQDSVSQVSAYHLGVSYTGAEKKELAIGAFDKVRQLDHDLEFKELGAYYYTKICYDLRDFSGVIIGSNFYKENFPNGSHLGEINGLESESYLYSGNYEEALEKIGAMKNKTLRAKAAYQKIAFNKGSLEYNDGKYFDATISLQKALAYPIDSTVKDMTCFWLGENYSQQEQYDSAFKYYRRIPKRSEFSGWANYGKAYAYYNLKQYQVAKGLFEQFLDPSVAAPQDLKTDALIRYADCNYVLKDYDIALANYNKAALIGSKEVDYLELQKGLTYKANNRFNDALNSFQVIINEHQDSRYLDRAYYELGMLNFENGREREAMRWFTHLIDEFPQSEMASKAYARRALAYKNAGKLGEAVNDFKKVLDISVNGEFSESAIRSLNEIASNGHVIQDLEAYQEMFGAANPESEVILQAKFESARAPFDQGDFHGAVTSLKMFADKYPLSAYAAEAYYLMGYSYEILEQPDSAAAIYPKVTEGSYRAKSLRNLGRILLDKEQYVEAIDNYLELQLVSRSKKDFQASLLGLMIGYYNIKDYESSRNYAERIKELKVRKLEPAADLYLGKVAYSYKEYEQAIGMLEPLTMPNFGTYGAEAQYMIGVILREQEQFVESTNAFIAVREKFESYPKWLVKAYLLIAENYIDVGDKVQTEHTLKSIIDYTDDPAIKAQAEARLAEL